MLEKTTLITALVGIMLILILSQQLEPLPTNITEINSKMLDQWVKVNGTITSIEKKANETLFILNLKSSSGDIPIVVYKNKAQLEISTLKDKQVEIMGKVTEYRGKLEIEASKIREI